MNPKPLGHRAYGSIPHLLGSRRGPADKGLPFGQDQLLTDPTVFAAHPRRARMTITVTEKLDGSNVAVVHAGDRLLALSRAGYLAATSPYAMHHRFAAWVEQEQARFMAALEPGQRLCGEWLIQAHGTRYVLPHEPFVAFDLMVEQRRLSRAALLDSCYRGGFIMPTLLHQGGAFSLAAALLAISVSGHGAVDPIEGAVWRLERSDECLCLGKFVRPEKVDGCYLPALSGQEVANRWPASCHVPQGGDA